MILVGASFDIVGLNFTAGSEVNFFVATGSTTINAGPLIPITPHSATELTVNVPATTPLGQGFASVQVVNTDQSFHTSNSVGALLQGSAAAGIPSLTSINGFGLASSSSDPSVATNNVETLVRQDTTVNLGGNGFDTVNGAAVNVFCDCTGGKVGPFRVPPGTKGFTTTSLNFTLPADTTTGPGSFVVINKGADGKYSKKSNAVSAPIGQLITVTSVTQSGSTITVNGTGFSTVTVINFFNQQSGGNVVNLGGLNSKQAPNIPLHLVDSEEFTFTLPAKAEKGPAYVQALNPPFIAFTSSGSGPGGSFVIE